MLKTVEVVEQVETVDVRFCVQDPDFICTFCTFVQVVLEREGGWQNSSHPSVWKCLQSQSRSDLLHRVVNIRWRNSLKESAPWIQKEILPGLLASLERGRNREIAARTAVKACLGTCWSESLLTTLHHWTGGCRVLWWRSATGRVNRIHLRLSTFVSSSLYEGNKSRNSRLFDQEWLEI